MPVLVFTEYCEMSGLVVANRLHINENFIRFTISTRSRSCVAQCDCLISDVLRVSKVRASCFMAEHTKHPTLSRNDEAICEYEETSHFRVTASSVAKRVIQVHGVNGSGPLAVCWPATNSLPGAPNCSEAASSPWKRAPPPII